MNKQEVVHELEWRRCRGKGPQDWKACLYFLKTYWHIRHPEQGKILFPVREAQEKTLQAWLTNRYTIVLKARQVGFSTLAAGMVFWLCFFHADKYVVLLSKTEDDAVKLLLKSKYGFKYLPDWMRERGPKLLAERAQDMPFSNDSTIASLQSKNDPARGETVYMVIVDEWASLPNPEEAWGSIEPITDIGGRVIGLSTAKGVGNFFYEMWVKATTGTNDFKPLFFPWSANQERDLAWYESKKRNMTEALLHQEYPTTPEEAFIKSGNPVFDVEALAMIDTEEPAEGYLWVDPRMGPKNPEFRLNPEGALQIWRHPQTGHKYVIGADVAQGLDYGDYSVAHVIDINTGTVVAKWRGHTDPTDFAEVIYSLGFYYNRALIGVEANNHGHSTLASLHSARYPFIYRRHNYTHGDPKKTPQLGWLTTAVTKPIMIDELAMALKFTDEQEADLTLMDSETIGELRTFVRDEKGKMHGSPYDDQVVSLAIANQMRKHSHVAMVEHEFDDSYSFEWWARQAEGPKFDDTWRIGKYSVRS